MVGAMPEDKSFALTWQIMEMERQIGKLNWWNFIKRYKMKQKLAGIRILAFRVGFELAMEELEKMGIVKKI